MEAAVDYLERGLEGEIEYRLTAAEANDYYCEVWLPVRKGGS
jgi:hypothetical protein